MYDSKIDILLINETKLDSTIHDSDVYIPGFEIVRKDRRVNGRKGGGVCIYLCTNLNYRIRDDLNNDDLESRDHQGERVNPPYRPSNYGNPS